MPQETLIDIPPCPTCGRTWRVTPRELEQYKVGYRGASEDCAYRVRCPNCHQFAIITLRIEEDEDA